MRFFLKYAAILDAAKSLRVREHGGWIFDAEPVDLVPVSPDLGNEFAIVCHYKDRAEKAEAELAGYNLAAEEAHTINELRQDLETMSEGMWEQGFLELVENAKRLEESYRNVMKLCRVMEKKK